MDEKEDWYSDSYSEIDPVEGERKLLKGSFPIKKPYYKLMGSKSLNHS